MSREACESECSQYPAPWGGEIYFIPLKSTELSGEPINTRVTEEQLPENGNTSYQKLDTMTVFTPPSLPEPVLRDFRGVRGRETSSPLPSDFEKCVAAAENDFGLATVPQFFDEDLQGFITFAEWLGTVNLSDSKTRLSLMRAKARGKVPIFERETAKGLTTLNPKKLLEKVYLRSLPIFNMEKDGEQLYGEPVEGSRVLLIDDLKTLEPVLQAHQYCILQTSAQNYQHFYVADRPLSGAERHAMQQMLAADHGGDPGATSGVQPHRMPGSINFKEGRELFVTRLIGCCTDGIAIPASFKLAELKTDSDEGGCRVLYEPSGPSLQSQSNKDYAWVMKNLRGTKKSRDQLISELNIQSLARGKHADYARLTVDNAIAAKTQLDSRRGR